MQKILLEANVRDMDIPARVLRRQRKIPAVYYGHKVPNMAVQLDYQTFKKVFAQAGGNQIVELNVGGGMKPVLIHEVQYDPLTDQFNHVDFLHINMDEEVNAAVPVVTKGVSPAVKNLGGILTTLKHEIEVRCLPANLPSVIEVDISGLEQLHSSIHISDLSLPAGVKFHANLDDVVVTVAPPKVEEEITTTEAALPPEGVPLAGAEEKEKAAAEAAAVASQEEKKK